MRRRAVKLEERLTPCTCCNHPISQRHHVLNFAEHGESENTTFYCANCHELYHIALGTYFKHSQRSAQIWNAFVRIVGEADQRVLYIISQLHEAADLHLQVAIESQVYD